MVKLNQKYMKMLASSWKKNTFNKFCYSLLVLFVLIVIFMFVVAQMYIHSERNKPLNLGVSFIPDYARQLGLDPKQTMDALLSINVRQFRLVSYWNDIEPTQNSYDFSELDWQFKKAETVHAKIILTLGLRQPRWPECHPPSWIDTAKPTNSWQPALEQYISKVIERYKNYPALQEYQLENEYFLKGFGLCNNFDRGRLVSEYYLVKSLDTTHPVIIGRSNNSLGFPFGQPRPDLFSISVYKRVWDAGVTRRYFEYPYPAWFYAYLAGFQKIFFHRDMIIAEMQAEAWAPINKLVTQVSLSEQNKSLDAKRLAGRFNYAKATGMKQIEMWGAEYWYYREKILKDASLMNTAKAQFQST